jgi:hypothetical protein
VALVTDPTYPVAGEAVTLSATSTNGASAFAFEITSRPSASEVTLGLLLSGLATEATATSSPVEAATLGILGDTFTPDVAGEYGITIYDLIERTTRARFAGDAAGPGNARYVLLATQSTTAHVGGVVALELANTLGHNATLVLEVVNETVRAATLEYATTEIARQATLVSGVTAALTAMVGSSPATIMGTILTRADDLASQLDTSDHYGTGQGGLTWHAASDLTNAFDGRVVVEAGNVVAGITACARSLEGHMRDYGLAATAWHSSDDLTNVWIAVPATTVGQAQVMLSDLRERGYERHRVNATAHTTDTDTLNALSAPTLFDNLVVAFFDEVVAASVTAPAGEPEGVADALHLGFDTGEHEE